MRDAGSCVRDTGQRSENAWQAIEGSALRVLDAIIRASGLACQSCGKEVRI